MHTPSAGRQQDVVDQPGTANKGCDSHQRTPFYIADRLQRIRIDNLKIVQACGGLVRDNCFADLAEFPRIAFAHVHLMRNSRESAIQHPGLPSLFWSEVRVARAQGEPILLAHDRTYDEL